MSLLKFILTGILLYQTALFAQKDLSNSDQKEAQLACENFLILRNQYLTDYSLSDQQLAEITSDSLLTYYHLLRDYYQLREITNIKFFPEAASEIYASDSGVYCPLYNPEQDTLLYFLILDQHDNKWQVQTYYDSGNFAGKYARITQRTNAYLLQQAQQDSIQYVISELLHGIDDLKELNDTSRIFHYSTHWVRQYFYIEHEMNLMYGKNYKNRRFDSLEFSQILFDSDTTASTRVRVYNQGSVSIGVKKTDGLWKVVQFGDREINQEYIAAKRIERDELILKNKLKTMIYNLGFALNNVFLKNDYTALEKMATPEMVYLLKLAVIKIGAYDPGKLKFNEYTMLSGVSIFDEDNYRIDADTLSYGENADLLVFLKSDTSWTFSGFYGVFDSTEVLIALEDYTSQLFEFSHLIYDPYNGVQFDTDIEIMGEPIEDMNLEEDLYVYTFFELDQPPHFAGNAAAMYSFIASEMRYPEEGRIKKIEGIVFVGFIVEKDGTLSNIRIVSSPNVLLNDEALRIVKNMPPWIPAPHPWNKDRDALRAEHVIAIDFNLP